MQVETYEVEEMTSDAANMAADSEAMEVAERLGLSGQLSLVNRETVTRNPYRRVTAEETAVFRSCFPNSTRVEEYRDGIIPLRVLQVLAHAKECEQFAKYYVWHPAAGQRDPVLVGVVEVPHDGSYKWTEEQFYLLARWGESLLPFEELKKKAHKILVTRFTNRLAKVQQEVESSSQRVEMIVSEMLNGGEQRSDPHFNW